MSFWILDTDHVSLFQHEHPKVRERFTQSISLGTVAITIITVQEQTRGWLNAINRAGNSNNLLWAYQGLQATIHYAHTIDLLEFDQAAYAFFGVA